MSSAQKPVEGITGARSGETVVPEFKKAAFHCPWCGVLATQVWNNLKIETHSGFPATYAYQVRCGNCGEVSIWLDGNPPQQLHPMQSGAPTAHPEMPEDVRSDYVEAAAILHRSPRAACALLRLGLQKLMVDLGEAGANLNSDIGSLVGKGLDPLVQKALDALRVIGNNAVHPGEFDVDDNPETAKSLFEWLNVIVEQMIARPRKLESLYGSLPPAALAAIEKRDQSGDTSA